MKKNRGYVLGGLLGAVLTSSQVSAQDLEISHFWRTDGETAALKVLRDSYEKDGGRWYEDIHPGMSDLHAQVFDRLSIGLPPTVFQWHAADDLEGMMEHGAIRPIQSLLESESDLTLLPFVAEAASVDGELVLAPVGVHVENRAWFDLRIYRELGLKLPQSWDAFLNQTDQILAAGYSPLIIGKDPWQRALLFTSILLEQKGLGIFSALAEGRRDRQTRDSTRLAVERLLRLREVANRLLAKPPTDWFSTTRMFAAQRAAIMIMGDWARPELELMGLRADQDFACDVAPGNSEKLAVAIDGIALARVHDPASLEAQRQFVSRLMTAPVLRKFAMTKGAAPPFTSSVPTELDECSKQAWNLIGDQDTDLIVLFRIFGEERMEAYVKAVDRLWETRGLSDGKAHAMFMEAMQR